METISLNQWTKYRDVLAKISNKAADEFRDAVFNKNGYFHGVGLGNIPRNELIDYAYALVTKYSEAESAAACMFYDELAALSGAIVPSALPAESASISEVGKAINGAIKNSNGNEETVTSTVFRLVKQAGQDTTLQNALRDGAQFAWIPSGDTCAFCIALASRGWQYASKRSIKNGHAEHIHGNCDCAYAVRFNENTDVAGYDPDKYLEEYESAEGDTPEQKINSMRRRYYEENKEKINEQKRSAYEKRKERESSQAEETNVD